jgi:hypothetical protein
MIFGDLRWDLHFAQEAREKHAVKLIGKRYQSHMTQIMESRDPEPPNTKRPHADPRRQCTCQQQWLRLKYLSTTGQPMIPNSALEKWEAVT